jgi:hypothetical protein
VGDEVPPLISYPYAMKKSRDSDAAVYFNSWRFFVETMVYPSSPTLASTGTAPLEHILFSYSDMEERND